MTDKTETQDHHFFASCVYIWRVNNDLRQLLLDMDKEKVPYAVWRLPVPKSTLYDINFYCPQVEGALHLGTFDPRPKRKASKKV